jgi:hypothetical protein
MGSARPSATAKRRPATRARSAPGPGFDLPAPIARLFALDPRIVERALGIANLDGLVRARAAGRAAALAEAGELVYKMHPFEVIPFAWQGGDGLVYALLVHDPAERRLPLVSYAAIDDTGPCWLGDDAAQGLASLMGVALRDADDGLDDPDERATAVEETAAAVRRVSRAIRVAPARDVRAFTMGARTKRTPAPPVPTGWGWVPTARGMGVLAPKSLFDPRGRHDADIGADPDAALGRALRLLTRGFPASALAVARDVYTGLHAYEPGVDTAAATVMRGAYTALGRPLLAARVDAYLAEQARRGAG